MNELNQYKQLRNIYLMLIGLGLTIPPLLLMKTTFFIFFSMLLFVAVINFCIYLRYYRTNEVVFFKEYIMKTFKKSAASIVITLASTLPFCVTLIQLTLEDRFNSNSHMWTAICINMLGICIAWFYYIYSMIKELFNINKEILKEVVVNNSEINEKKEIHSDFNQYKSLKNIYITLIILAIAVTPSLLITFKFMTYFPMLLFVAIVNAFIYLIYYCNNKIGIFKDYILNTFKISLISILTMLVSFLPMITIFFISFSGVIGKIGQNTYMWSEYTMYAGWTISWIYYVYSLINVVCSINKKMSKPIGLDTSEINKKEELI